MRRKVIIALTALCAVLMTGCGGRDSGTTPANEGTAVTDQAEGAETPMNEASAETTEGPVQQDSTKENSSENVLGEEDSAGEGTDEDTLSNNNDTGKESPNVSDKTNGETASGEKNGSNNENGQKTTSNDIGVQKAKNIALKDAGVQEKNVKFVEAKKEWDDGRSVYDIEFYSKNKEYDYEIEAASGTIISSDHDIEDYDLSSSGNQSGNSSSATITMDEAKKIALKKVGLNEKDGKWKKEKKDRDDGRTVYELEFVSGKVEYEFEIDAKSGKILEYDRESVYD